ncbi:hypothetical protein ACOMHN_061157 [Nucella lapillus]
MLLELLVLAGCFIWAVLCLVTNSVQQFLHFIKNLILGLLSLVRTLAAGLVFLVTSVILGVWFLIRGFISGVYRCVVLVTWTVPCLVLGLMLAVVCQVARGLWRGIHCALPYSLLLCAGFVSVHLLWQACRSQSLSEVLTTLNLTLPNRACPF